MKLEEVEQLTGLEGVKAEVEEVEEVNGANCRREGKAFSRCLMFFLNSPCLPETSSPDSFEECSERSPWKNSQ